MSSRIDRRLGDTSGTPSMIAQRVLSMLWDVQPMPPADRSGWYRELARMLSAAADKWDAYLASDQGKP